MYHKLASIMLNSGQNASSTSEIFISQPNKEKELLAGKLFILIEIEANPESLKIINFLINNLEHNYYNNEKIILRERIQTLKIEHIFESSLTKTNKDFIQFLAREKIHIKPDSFNATVGIIDKDSLHFSNVGKNKAFLIHKYKQEIHKEEHQAKISYKIVNIEGEKEKTDFNEEKIFSNVISGQIPKNGYFLFTNETLPEYLSNKQLVETITKLQPRGAAEQIKNILSDINAYVSFLGLIIKNTIGSDVVPEVEEKSADESISQLNRAEETTENLLAPSGIINSKKWMSALKKATSGAKEKIKSKAPRNIALKDKIFVQRKASLISLEKIKKVAKNILLYLVGFISYIAKIASNKEHRTKVFSNFKSCFSWLGGLNSKSKIILTIFILLVTLFTSSLIYTNIQNKKEEEQIAHNELITSIEQKQNQIDAHLLYGNEEGAKKILDEVATLLSQLQEQEQTLDEKQYDTYAQKNEEHLEKIRHVFRVDPIELADLKNLNSEAQAENIILTDNKIYTGDTAQKTVYSLDLSNELITAITSLDTDIKTLRMPTTDDANNIYYFSGSNVLELDTNDSFASFNVDAPQSIVATDGFNNRIYALSPDDNQIYRYKKGVGEFGENLKWLNTNVNLANTVDISIDGHIYVLKKNGEVLEFLKGEQLNLYMETAEPAIEDAKKIIVSPDKEFIYILEPKNNRLVIFNKTGEFLMQYTADKFNNIQDFAVDEADNKIYILNDNKIYQFEGSHF